MWGQTSLQPIVLTIVVFFKGFSATCSQDHRLKAMIQRALTSASMGGPLECHQLKLGRSKGDNGLTGDAIDVLVCMDPAFLVSLWLMMGIWTAMLSLSMFPSTTYTTSTLCQEKSGCPGETLRGGNITKRTPQLTES